MTTYSTWTARTIACVAALSTLLVGIAYSPRASANSSSGPGPRVVVAVVDDGINAYHEFFHAGGTIYKKAAPTSVTPAVLKEFGIEKDNIIKLTRTGNFAADFAKDKAQFEKIKKGEPYWFKGTNMIGISFEDGAHLRPDGEGGTHGIGTAGAVLAGNPDAIIVSVQGINNDSEKWAFTHPAVDIVSNSYGPITSVPTANHLTHSYEGVVEKGKMHFGAAANDPTYAGLDETAGPWWSVGIAGFEEDSSNGRQLLSGQVPDFIGDFSQDLPYCRSCEMGLQNVSGTSFATPKSAGTFSKVLLEARRAAGHVGGIKNVEGEPHLVTGKFNFTNWEMRRALEEAAIYPNSSEYSTDPTATPVNDDAPWYQTGWGLITPKTKARVIEETLRQLGLGPAPKREKSQDACDFMTQNMQARRAYWNQAAVMGDSFGDTEDPYIYCQPD